MGRVVATEFVTLDGIMEAPGGEPSHAHTGWVVDFFSDEFGAFKHQEIIDAEAHLLGRVTFESFAGSWPDMEGPMADRMTEMPKYVTTNTLTSSDWANVIMLPGETVAAVSELKQQLDGDILIAGSCQLVHTLLRAGLIDELRLNRFPVTIGSGLRLFPDSPDKTTWNLAETKRFGEIQIDVLRR